jgi:pimeloyl-ACP methyl ester carboxylesterase
LPDRVFTALTEMQDRASNPYLINPYRADLNLPLLIFLPGMDETGAELMKVQTASLKQMFGVRCLIIPPDNFDDWDVLTQETIELARSAIGQTSRQVYLCGESFGSCIGLKVLEVAPKMFDRIVLINSVSSFRNVLFLNLGSRMVGLTPHFLYDFFR